MINQSLSVAYTHLSSGTASTIFSYIAADVLPNTPGNEFTVENAYAADGQTLDYTADPNDSRNSSNKSWTDKASDVVNDVKDQASSLWAVSYTHLDVYKRQKQLLPTSLNQRLQQRQLWIQE